MAGSRKDTREHEMNDESRCLQEARARKARDEHLAEISGHL